MTFSATTRSVKNTTNSKTSSPLVAFQGSVAAALAATAPVLVVDSDRLRTLTSVTSLVVAAADSHLMVVALAIFSVDSSTAAAVAGVPHATRPDPRGERTWKRILRWTSGKPPRAQRCLYSSPARRLVPPATALDPKPETRRPADTATAPGLPLKTKGHSGFPHPACTAAARGR